MAQSKPIKAYLAEFIGTFALVFIGTAVATLQGPGVLSESGHGAAGWLGGLAASLPAPRLHIRLLILTFFLQFFPDLVRNGHVYILETPLFRVRNKKETHYCYSNEEKQIAMEKVGKNPEITRFKGLGEISPNEFKYFIGKDIRLEPVILGKENKIQEILTFFMGKNTPDRQKFIIENLRVEEEIEL